MVAADDLECRVSLEFSTVHDEDLDIEDLPVPDADLLPDAILHLFEEEFEIEIPDELLHTQSESNISISNSNSDNKKVPEQNASGNKNSSSSQRKQIHVGSSEFEHLKDFNMNE